MVALIAEKSANKKIVGKGHVSATYVATNVSCPTSCSLRGAGCYAEYGRVGIHVKRLNQQVTPGMRPEAAARRERQVIRDSFRGGPIPQDGAQGGRDLRLHVSGDARTRLAAQIVADAARDWKARGGGDVWTYTHGWEVVPARDWGPVSVLASIEDPKSAKKARRRGYAPALIVPQHPSDKSYRLAGSNVKWIPCPSQTRGIPCSDCRLCMKAKWLRSENLGIAFAAHGATQRVKKHLKVVA